MKVCVERLLSWWDFFLHRRLILVLSWERPSDAPTTVNQCPSSSPMSLSEWKHSYNQASPTVTPHQSYKCFFFYLALSLFVVQQCTTLANTCNCTYRIHVCVQDCHVLLYFVRSWRNRWIFSCVCECLLVISISREDKWSIFNNITSNNSRNYKESTFSQSFD